METSKEIVDLLNFLNTSPTAWQAVDNVRKKLLEAGFHELSEEAPWKIAPKGKYFVARNGSSICAFVLPEQRPTNITLVASHTDSPGFKLKPHAEFLKENMVMLGVEVYGAPLLSSWLNRDLGIAGRVVTTNKKGTIEEHLLTIEDHPVVIPQLAIHLDREVNEKGLVLHKQEHLAALAGQKLKKVRKDEPTHFLHDLIKERVSFETLLGFDLFLYPLEKARLVGIQQEWISGYRIDSLCSVHAALHGFLKSKKPREHTIKMAAFWDNEEIGSNTSQGAGSPFLLDVIERIQIGMKLNREEMLCINRQSLCVSVDLGHALHPNYGDKHEPRHQVLLNGGIVLKHSAQHRYATDAASSAKISRLCHEEKIPLQHQVPRGDLPCGTTIGPIHSSLTGMPTVDIGCSQLSMHSCRELAGALDHLSMCTLLHQVFEKI
jgi:aspartyl aminopeptidase